jgi:hypothetical protein
MKQDATTVAEAGSSECMTASYTIAIAGLRSTSLPNVCMYSMYACMYVCMYVCMCDLKLCMHMYVCMYLCIYKCACIYAHVCMNA